MRVSVEQNRQTEMRLVMGCIPEQRTRTRVQMALRGHAALMWTDSFADLRQALSASDRPATVVIALQDSTGATAATLARDVRDSMTGTAVVLCCDLSCTADGSIASAAQSGAHDLLLTGVNDEGFTARTVILGAAVSAAADIVMKTVRAAIPPSLLRFVELAVRHPRELQRVADVSRRLTVARQTLSRCCKREGCLPPEELLIWARLFLVAALFENTPWTLETIAREMGYGSPSALRNRIRGYTGMTAMDVRAKGLGWVLRMFQEQMPAVVNSATRIERLQA